MSEEKRTTAAWANYCLEALKSVHPCYERNREIKGRFIEFVREDESGLTISHNFIKIRDNYYYCFALLFTRSPTIRLSHCLMAGSRFDDNRTIWRQFNDDLGLYRGDIGYPSGVWSFGSWRENTIPNLTQGLKIADLYLLPFYRDALRAGKSKLICLFEEARRMIDTIPVGCDVQKIAEKFIDTRIRYEQLQRECYSLDALKLAKGGVAKYEYGPPEPGFRVDDVGLDVIVFSQLEVFLSQRERLSDIVEIARKL